MRVEIWSDVSCPWCYVGKARFERGLAAFAHKDQVEVVFRSFELDPERAKGDTVQVLPMLARKYGMSLEQARQAEARVAANAEDAGLAYLTEGRDHGNTFDIHRVLHFAATKDRQDALIDLVYRANFAEERSVFDDEYLVELAVRAGLDEAEVRAVLADESAFAAEVRADEREAAELGATGVPFFVLDRKYGVSGGQPAEVFTQALEQAWGDRTPVLNVVGEAPDGAVCGPDGCEIP
ncbi:DsbA family oxidoreductase [Yinghuangia seranimata]|uniref:DsbA family oxidoreductase n=1 Tax=Yinghuangia seranimata TaxID=408067 RepID=UPI00248B4753|nr:DsbA family oxidoreductase [Yinghuangia seranimata]MDI2125198.1 DsbA family oxidoreductase [Yinghuangia seranimata]